MIDSTGKRSYRGKLQAVVFDWAGTTVDWGSFAPTAVFLRLFAQRNVPITIAQARGPMGLMKRDHLAAIFALPDVRRRWQYEYDREPDTSDLDAMFTDFVPMQMDCIADYAAPVPGLLETIAALRARSIKIGSTTGYTRAMMEVLIAATAKHGYTPDSWVTPSDVPAGRPAPWMCYQNAMSLNVFPMAAMVKVGDTLPDIEEGLNAGMWTIGLALSGNMLGLSESAVAALPADELELRRTAICAQFEQAGAHYVVNTVADVPAILDHIEERLAAGEKPQD
ncbi:MAG: phosphonoacetaldehyde hydrolase [Caldilineaceae bacterium]